MKRLKFLVNVLDKYTGEEYKVGQVKEFNNKRTEEILKAIRSNGEPYAVIVDEVEVATKKVKAETAIKKSRKKNNNDI